MLTGNTPLIELNNFTKANSVSAVIYAKAEFFNPTGSVKDRTALALIEDAERRGRLKKGGVVVEPTSGNTGIALAAVAAVKGYKAVLTMPENMSAERINLIKAYGARVVLTPAAAGMRGAVEEAERIAAQNPDAVLAGQFVNSANPEIHARTTGPEIWRDTGGDIDMFVCGVGTGGTLTGAGGYLKRKNPAIKIIAVEPASSPVLSGGAAGLHKIQGIGAGFVPEILDTAIYDGVLPVTDGEAFAAAKSFGAEEGLLVGISSGAALAAAVRAGRTAQAAGKKIVVLLPDSADRYYSTELFN
ncbi:MAG: cysteine synthase A [Clostridia bacterium]|nr:cysteine synthase A [Clostridia bacterium]